ncbi:isocitrate lyase/phosphoenolpyruvate mutase family protein [Streptomyces sp. NPDC048659]|uniref:isocitrate lyase/PEP mutase family protein n=1 Tax=Streptomyces sp. NPDC048659 TaxID=3155489 RepID=UPI00341431B0
MAGGTDGTGTADGVDGVGRAGQAEKGAVLRRLHERGVFVVANAWDAESAAMLTGLGFPALATTSGGLALALGRPDAGNLISRAEALANAAAIAEATTLPVTADLESGYGATPDDVAETIRLAAAVGLAGGSIEDATGDPAAPVRPLGEAVERVEAAVAAARALPFPFVITARAENHLYGRDDLADTIARLQAFEAAGADVLYAPGLPGAAEIRSVCAAVGRPVNVLAGRAVGSVAELAALGARRVSLGSSLARAEARTPGAGRTAAEEVATAGTFGFLAAPPASA